MVRRSTLSKFVCFSALILNWMILTESALLGQQSLLEQQSTAQDQTERAEQRLYSTPSMAEVHSKVKAFAAKYTAEKVLVVFDIDNTLLAMNQDLGSDQWFNWQSTLMNEDPDSPHLVARKFPDLLKVQATLYALSSMHPPEPKLAEIVAEIQALRVKAIALTSRGPAVRNSTERELDNNKFDFSESAVRIHENRGIFLPYDPLRPTAHGLSIEIVKTLGTPRIVSYSAGVFLTSGQHKGYMLRTLLSREVNQRGKQNHYEAIVFIDDHKRNCTKMIEAFRGSSVEVAAYIYTREDGNVENFKQSNKRHVIRGWKKLKKTMDQVFVKKSLQPTQD